MNRKQWMLQGSALIRTMDAQPAIDVPAGALFRSNREKRFFEYQMQKRQEATHVRRSR